jgi:hypothetical protein
MPPPVISKDRQIVGIATGAGIICAALLTTFVITQYSRLTHRPSDHSVIADHSSPPIKTPRHASILPEARAFADPTGALRPALHEALDPATAHIRRHDLIRALPSDLSEAEALTLIGQLNAPPPPTEIAWHSTYIHLICNVLQRIPAFYDPFASALAELAADRRFPEVHRDYAFQHLRILWHRSRDQSTQPDHPDERHNLIEGTFRNLLLENPETTAQSLLGLHEIRHPDGTYAIQDEEITSLVQKSLNNSAAIPHQQIPARMTAVRILAERRIPGSSPILRDIAANTSEHNLVRASAIAAIGHIGAPSDIAFLHSLPSQDPLISGALQHSVSSK